MLRVLRMLRVGAKGAKGCVCVCACVCVCGWEGGGHALRRARLAKTWYDEK